MIRGIYAAASSMVSNFRRQQVVANNVANASTTGYKQDMAIPTDFPKMLIMGGSGSRRGMDSLFDAIGGLGSGMDLSEVLLDLSQGDFTETGNALDLAINGAGFFAVQTLLGQQYTRDGTFFRDASGHLARADGGLLLGEDGPIQANGGEILIDGDGTVTVDGEVAGRIRLVDFGPQDKLVKVGNNYVVPESPDAQERPAEAAAINQGFLERSNVDLTRAMVEMMSAMRSYEASQKMILLQDQALDRAVNEVGRV